MAKKQIENQKEGYEEKLDKIIQMLEMVLEELDSIRYYAEEVYNNQKK